MLLDYLYGFIVKDDGTGDVYFNRASLRRDRDYDPVEGDSVEFDVEKGPKGLQAANVTVVR